MIAKKIAKKLCPKGWVVIFGNDPFTHLNWPSLDIKVI